MNAVELITDLARLGTRIEAHGDRLRYSPRSAVTPELAERMKAHKGELLAILRRKADTPAIDLTDATAVWQAALDRLEGDLLFPPDLIATLRAADVQWASAPEEPASGPVPESLGPDGWPVDCIDPDDLEPCPKCGTLELWQTLASDVFGSAPGRWRCAKCEPPTTAQRLRELANRVRQQAIPSSNAGRNGQ